MYHAHALSFSHHPTSLDEDGKQFEARPVQFDIRVRHHDEEVEAAGHWYEARIFFDAAFVSPWRAFAEMDVWVMQTIHGLAGTSDVSSLLASFGRSPVAVLEHCAELREVDFSVVRV